jgi:hypothetical protein
VSFFEIIRGRAWELFAEQRLDVVFPQEIDHFFVGEHRISAAELDKKKQ